jgi:two-component system, LuxR family, response regulator FixJ
VCPEIRRLVYVVDDDEAVRDSLVLLLEAAGTAAQCYDSGKALLADADLTSALLFIFDIHMPGMSGLDLLAELRARGLSTPVLLLTGRSDPVLDAAARRLNAVMLSKPPEDETLLRFVRAATGP